MNKQNLEAKIPASSPAPGGVEELVGDSTNRLYVRTPANPDGELIMGPQVTEWIDNLLDTGGHPVLLLWRKEADPQPPHTEHSDE